MTVEEERKDKVEVELKADHVHEMVPHWRRIGVKVCAWCGKTREEILNK